MLIVICLISSNVFWYNEMEQKMNWSVVNLHYTHVNYDSQSIEFNFQDISFILTSLIC